MLYLTIFLTVTILGSVSILGYFAYSLAKSFTKPNTHRQFRVYVDYYIENLPREDITIKTKDGIKISGWLFKNESDCAVILVHGIRANKSIMNSLARFYFDKGFTVLSIDLRNHGESEKNTTTLGYKERFDVEAAAEFLKNRGYKNIIVHGISMGAVASILARIENPDLIDVVIADSPYLSLEESSKFVFRRFPNFISIPLSKLAITIGEKFTGLNISMLNLKQKLDQVDGNIFFIFSEYDPFTKIEEVRSVLKNKEYWIVPNTWHGLAFKWYPEIYQKRSYEFICKKTTCCN